MGLLSRFCLKYWLRQTRPLPAPIQMVPGSFVYTSCSCRKAAEFLALPGLMLPPHLGDNFKFLFKGEANLIFPRNHAKLTGDPRGRIGSSCLCLCFLLFWRGGFQAFAGARFSVQPRAWGADNKQTLWNASRFFKKLPGHSEFLLFCVCVWARGAVKRPPNILQGPSQRNFVFLCVCEQA